MSNTEVITKRASTDPEHLHDSEEYESAEEIDGEVYDDEEIEEVEVEIEEEDVEEEEEEEDEDGQTPVPKERELDDDEDRKNPQFIPKKGYFYEHDDRTKVDDGEEEEEEEKVEEKPKKVVVSKEADKWSHDKYEEVEQTPKSHDELSAAYGYDIRSEDQPPRARRRRRYGRGPNKYTRKWEEEEAYQKPRGGYRGRGGGGGGRGGEGGRGFRNSYNNRRSSQGGYEEDFPELVDGPEKKGLDRGDSSRGRGGGSSNRRERDRDPNGSNQPPARNRGAWTQDRDRNDREDREREFESGRGGNGGRGGGRGGGGNRGGRGRRNEFTNRNRYPDRRDSFNNNNNHTNSSGSNNKQNSSFNGPPTDLKEREKEKQEKHWAGHDDRRERPTVNGSTHMDKQKAEYPSGGGGGGGGAPNHSRQQQSVQKKANLPFTNTEYTGSASLTAGNRNPGSNSGSSNNIRIAPPEFENISVKVGAEPGVKDVRFVGARDQPNDYRDSRENVSRENIKENMRDSREVQHVPEHRDAREIINERQAMREREAAMLERHKDNNRDSREREMRDNRDNRDVNRRPPNKGYQNDRRPQMPPRLQQQQQQQLEQANLAAKTKRFSTQRQRQVETTMVSGGVVHPNAVVSPQLGPGVGNLQPVVTGAGPMITSPVPVYPQAATYYETAPSGFDAQVYEASASPVTGNGHNHGPSVSPSLWAPHASAYATAPYPSPPTGQVPVPQPPYADPAAFIAAAQQTGQPIYAPPQFIQDPTIINYAAAQGAPFAAPYHPQGFQGYAQVTPAPPPEMYHGGVTYYSTQNQIQRPPMIAPSKRPKTVLQLVEPPEKAKESHQKQKELPVGENYSIQNSGMTEYYEIQEPQTQQSTSAHHPEEFANYEPELPQPQSLENITSTLQPVAPVEFKKQRSPSPRQIEIPEKESWSAQMAELQSPTETAPPIASFSNASSSHEEVESPKAAVDNTESDTDKGKEDISTEKEQDSNLSAPDSQDSSVSVPVSAPAPAPEIPQQKIEISKDEPKPKEIQVAPPPSQESTEVAVADIKEETTNNTSVSEKVEQEKEKSSPPPEEPIKLQQSEPVEKISVVEENQIKKEAEKPASPIPIFETKEKEEESPTPPPPKPAEGQQSKEEEKNENI